MSLTTTVSELNSHDEKKLVECHMNHRGTSQPTVYPVHGELQIMREHSTG